MSVRSEKMAIDGGSPVTGLSNRVQRIQELAYRRAEERGFSPGAELDDWLAAEQQIDEEIKSTASVGQRGD